MASEARVCAVIGSLHIEHCQLCIMYQVYNACCPYTKLNEPHGLAQLGGVSGETKTE